MKYEFNNDQIEILKTSLENQNDIWEKNKKTREYYDADLQRLNECKKILNDKLIFKIERKNKMIEPQHMLVEERGLESQIKRLKVLLMGKGFEQLNSIIEELENIKFSIKCENDRILKDKLKQNS